jgi:cystathionine beta-lyase
MVSDEIWADFLFGDARHLPMASLGPEIAERTVTLYSAGKSFSLAGLRCAVIHFGSAKLQEDFHKRFPPRMLGGLNVAGADATITAWRQAGDWFDAVLRQLEANRDTVTAFVDELAPAVTGHPPEATYLYWLDCTGLGLDGTTPAKFFRESAKVQLSGGEEFGPEYASHVRLNFATSPEVLGEILDRRRAAVERRRPGGAA